MIGKVIGVWVFSEIPGPQIVGGMRCRHCGKKLDNHPNTFCYTRDYVNNTNMFECEQCGQAQGKSHWNRFLNERHELEEERQRELTQTDPAVLIERIKDAYFEGFDDNHGVNHLDEPWETSYAKEVYDALKALWNTQ